MTLEDVKRHLRVVHDQDDALISMYWMAAEAYIAELLGEDLPDPAPAPIDSAVLLLTGDLYENRERQSYSPLHLNTTFAMLLNPYRSMEVC